MVKITGPSHTEQKYNFSLNITRIACYILLNDRPPLSREAGTAGLGDEARLVGGVKADQKSRSLCVLYWLRAGETRAPLWGGGTSKARVSAIG